MDEDYNGTIYIISMAYSKKILVIESNEAIREAMMLKFKKFGIKPEFAADGFTGIEKLKNGGLYAAVLLDLYVPSGNGFFFLEEKNRIPAVKDVPVLIFTNVGQPELIRKALRYGVKGYLLKAHHSIQEIVEETQKCIEKKECRVDY